MQAFEEQDYTKRFDLSLWKKLLRIAKPYHRNLFYIIAFMGVCAIMDVLLPRMNAYAIDVYIAGQSTEGIGGFIAAYVLMTAIQVGCIFGFLRQSGFVETSTCYLIRKLGFRKLQELPFSYYDRMPVGYLMSRLTNDTQRLADTIGWSLVDLCWGAVFLVACTVQMLVLNWRLTLIVLLVLPPLAVISWKFQKGILEAYRQVRKRNSQITAGFNEGINGAKTTKTLVREEMNIEEFDVCAREMRHASVRAATLSALFLPIVVSLGSLATAYAMVRGGYSVLGGVMTLGTLQVFINYTVQFFQPVRDIARIFAELQSSQAAAERVISLLETEPDIVDSPEVEAVFGDNFHPKKENWPKLVGDIDFEDVTFRYKEGEKVLEHFNLHVKHGQTIALVGETGSGKSTIVNLVCRFYEPTEGRVLIDGEDYRTRSQLWLQSNLGYVLQSPHLFSGTVADNIRYGRPDASDEEVRRAAQMVGAEPFILKMTDGYNAKVGEGGNRLSTGQKQLISFARAILTNPAIFVLDEATSSVDTETEQLIQNAIQTVLSGRTSFIIAHRLSTIRSADRILVIQNGEIIEDGTHRQLIARQGYYYQLYTNQFQEEQGLEILDGKA
ncbi:MAG: ABC transporter ATP-binding protein [Christensenellaceae bacterium]|nr:ABC transporter ATP-binding protein [Christensenellaceae bacterium]